MNNQITLLLTLFIGILVYRNSYGQVNNPSDKEVLMNITLTDKNKIPEEEAIIRFKEIGGKIVKEGKTDIDGKLDLILPQGKIFDVIADKYGITFKFGQTKMPNTGEPIQFTYDLEISVDTIFKYKYTLENVYFDINKATLKRESDKALNTLYEVLINNPNMIIEIAGHTDITGNSDLNLKLSYARAGSVRLYLVQKGIDINRLYSKGYGEKLPVASNDTEAGRAKNRRTEIRVIRE